MSTIGNNGSNIFNDDIKRFAPFWPFPTGDNNTINLSGTQLSSTDNLIAFCIHAKMLAKNISALNIRNNTIEGIVDIRALCSLFTHLKTINVSGNHLTGFIFPETLNDRLTIIISDYQEQYLPYLLPTNIVLQRSLHPFTD